MKLPEYVKAKALSPLSFPGSTFYTFWAIFGGRLGEVLRLTIRIKITKMIPGQPNLKKTLVPALFSFAATGTKQLLTRIFNFS